MDLFGTAGIRGPVGDVVTPDLALSVGRAAGADGDEFVVGRDGRTTGSGLADAVAAGLQSAGADVRVVGQVPTPALAFAARDRHGVMLTASHNPPTDNGIKLFDGGVEYDREAERRIDRRVEDPASPADWDEWGGRESESVLADYRAAVADYARGHGAALDGLRVVVDAGNGVGGLATPQVLTDLGASVTALAADVDGHFPARDSKPTPESVRTLRSFVADGGADLGVAHDGDADRVVFVGPDGEVVHEDTVVAVLAEHFVRASDAGDPVVVTTPNASSRIDDRVAAAGGRVERVRLGALHEGIARVRAAGDGGAEGDGRVGGEGGAGGDGGAANESGAGGDGRTEVAFAAEPWKHIHPAFGGWIDGVASAVVVARLVAAAGGVASLTAAVEERPYRKVSVDCPDDRKAVAMDRLAETLPAEFPDAAVDTDHGVRLDRPEDGWVLVRPSGTEPYVRIYAEAEDVDALVERARETVERAVGGDD